MPQEINSKKISEVLANQIAFSDQEVRNFNDEKELGYRLRELEPERKDLIISKVEEIKNLVFQIIDEVSKKNNLVTFFESLGNKNTAVFFENFIDSFTKGAAFKLDQSVIEGGSSGRTKILKNNGEIQEFNIEKNYQSFDGFLKKLDIIKNYYSNALNGIRSFSIEDILNKMGYSSLEEMDLYYQKFLELEKTPEYNDFIEKKGDNLLKNLSTFNLKDFIYNKIRFLFEIKINISKNSWGTPVMMDLKLSPNLDIFFHLDKYKIDNFKDFINSYKVNIQSDFPEHIIPSHLYVNPEEASKNEFELHHGIDNFITRNKYYYDSDTSKSIIHHYYKEMASYSYENGLYFSYYNFINNTILEPLYNDILDIYKKPYESYNLDKILTLSFDFFEKIIQSSIEKNTVDVARNILLKRYVSNIPIKNIQTDLKLEIIKKTKENKIINIDNILKEIDFKYKNYLDDTFISNQLKIDIELTKKQLKINFNKLFSNEIKKKINEGFLNIFTKTEFLSENYSKDEEGFQNKKVDIKPILSSDQIALLLLKNKFDNLNYVHSYRMALEKIDNEIENRKRLFFKYKNNNDLINKNYIFKNITTESIENFFNNLKKILIKQLQQEELVLQQKTSSRGFIEELKFDNVNIKDLPIEVPVLQNITNISNVIPDAGIFSIFKSFDSQIFDNLHYILKYFSIFPDEAETFFNLNDFNQIKNAIIKILNFINSNDIYDKLDQIEDLMPVGNSDFITIDGKIIPVNHPTGLELKQKISNFPDDLSEYDFDENYRYIERKYGFSSFEEYSKEKNNIEKLKEKISTNKISAIQFLDIYFKNIDLGTKKEKIERLLQVSRLIHNFGSNSNYLYILIQSNYFKKSYNRSVFEILSTIGTLLPNDNNNEYEDEYINIKNLNLIDTLNIIEEKNLKLIPEGYLSEDMVYCLKYAPQIKTGDDLDRVVEKLLSGNYSENIRRFKFLVKLATQYSATAELMEKAKPKVEGVFEPSFSTDFFRFRVLGDLDPYHFSVGIDTNCCQAIGGQGESAAVDSFINPTAGVVVLEVKNDYGWVLAAQSYFHYVEWQEKNSAEVKKAILLDNIEAGRFEQIYKSIYPKAYAILGSYLKNKGFEVVGCGRKYTYVIESNDFEMSSLSGDPRHFEVEKHGFSRYTDFNSGLFFDLLKPKFSFEMPKNIGAIETEMTIKSARILDLCIQKTGNKKAISLNKLSKTLLGFGFKKEASAIYKLVAINLT